jgi:hypothetical protein
VLLAWTTVVYGQDKSLVLALSFDEGKGNMAEDSSQYNFDAVIKGPNWVNGKFDKAVGFDGVDDTVEVADAPELRLLKGGTVMAWAYIQGGGHASWPRLIHKSNITGGTGPGYEILFDRAQSDSVRVCLGGECQTYTPTKRETWHHITMTFDEKMVRVYVDGGTAAEKPQLGPIIDSPDMPLILGNSFNAQRQFQGYIDEVRIWSRVLTIDEIKAQMGMTTNNVITSVAPDSNLAATWAKLKCN